MKVKIWTDGITDLNNDEIWFMEGKPNFFRSKGERGTVDGNPYTIINPVGENVSLYRDTAFPVDKFIGAAAYRDTTEIKTGDLIQFVIYMRVEGPVEGTSVLFIEEKSVHSTHEATTRPFTLSPSKGWRQFQVTHPIVRGGECTIRCGVKFLTTQKEASTAERVEFHLDEPNLLVNEA